MACARYWKPAMSRVDAHLRDARLDCPSAASPVTRPLRSRTTPACSVIRSRSARRSGRAFSLPSEARTASHSSAAAVSAAAERCCARSPAE
jgi:hypothetical protein